MKKLITIAIYVIFSLTTNAQNIQTETLEKLTSGTWVNFMKYNYSYDGNGHRTYYIGQSWDVSSSSWKNDRQVSYTNNNNGTIQQWIAQDWSNPTSSWINTQRSTYTYNGSNKILSQTYEIGTSGTWVNQLKYTYTYDGNGYATLLLRQSWDVPSSSWKNDFQITYTNDGNGVVQEYLNESWDIPSSSWKNMFQGTYTYNGSNNLIFLTSKIYQNGAWVNYSRNYNIYDGNGYLTYNLGEIWDSPLSEWKNNVQLNYTNNSDGTVQQDISEIWDIPSSSWKYWLRSTYTYTTSTGIEDANEISFQLFPNPCNDILNLSFSNNSETKIEIKDLQGRLILSKLIYESSVIIDIQDLPSNLYFLQLQQGNKISVTKFIKE